MNNISKDLSKAIQDAIVILDEVKQDRITKRTKRWNEKEILGHLIDSAINNYSRFIRGYKSQKLVFDGYDQDLWVDRQDYNRIDWKDIVATWKNVNYLILNLLSTYEQKELLLKIDQHNFGDITFKKVPNDQPIGLEYLIRDYIDHLNHHIAQIQELNG